ncbi:MAG: hypothetical protein HRU70_09650 [Phycisphaeraceae bacterium]|nr:MAG: hypothetical protein HRU70_09650 [Phycisphaeraceae bacterium]
MILSLSSHFRVGHHPLRRGTGIPLNIPDDMPLPEHFEQDFLLEVVVPTDNVIQVGQRGDELSSVH